MTRRLLIRLFSNVLLMLALPTFVFCLMELVPGDFLDPLRLDPNLPESVITHYRTVYGLELGFWHRIGGWLMGIAKFDFGYSFTYQQSVCSLIIERASNTLILTVPALFLSYGLGTITGVWSGYSQMSLESRCFSAIADLFLSIPSFLLCMILLVMGSFIPGLPLGGMSTPEAIFLSPLERLVDLFRHMIIPVVALSMSSWAFIFRLMKKSAIEESKKLYMLRLHASKVHKYRIIWIHLLRNSINPLISLIGMEFPVLIAGASFVEIFTSWPGLGSLFLQAIRSQDPFLVLGIVFILNIFLVVGNLTADLFQPMVDPRVQWEQTL